MRRQFEGGDSKAQICVAGGDYSSVASDRGNTVATIRIHKYKYNEALKCKTLGALAAKCACQVDHCQIL